MAVACGREAANTGALIQTLNGPAYGFDRAGAVASDGTRVWVTIQSGDSVTEFPAPPRQRQRRGRPGVPGPHMRAHSSYQFDDASLSGTIGMMTGMVFW